MMSENPQATSAEERSLALREDADNVLSGIHLRDHCASIGEIVPSGSYFLDLMIYPDIDLYLPPTTPDRLLSVAAKLSCYSCVKEINFKKGGVPGLENGLYLKPIVALGNWERPWKIDIWCLPMDIVREKQSELEDLKRRMTPEDRRRILEYKCSILTPAGRTPICSGIFIYRAIVDRGMVDPVEITAFLRSNGVEM